MEWLILAAAIGATAVDSEVTAYPPAYFAEARPATAFDMIARLPGFSFDGGNQARGLAGTAGNVLIEGQRPASKSDGLEGILRRIPASRVQRIDLIRGGAPGMDMQGKSLVANVVQMPQGGLSGAVIVRGGAVITQDRWAGGGQFQGAWKDAGQAADIDISYQDGSATDAPIQRRTRNDPSNAAVLDSRTDTHANNQSLSIASSTDTQWLGGALKANLRLSRQDSHGTDGETFFTPGPPRRQSNASDQRSGEVGGRYSHPLTETTSLELVGLVSERDATSRSFSATSATASQTQRDETSGERTARATLHLRPNNSLSVDAGGEGAFNFLRGSSVLSVGGVISPVPGSSAVVEERRGEAFAVATLKVRSDLTFEAAVRGEASTLSTTGRDKDLRFFKPSLQASWQATPKLQVRLRAERTVGQLNFGDFLASTQLATGVITAGAVDLSPTQDDAISLTAEQQFWDKGLLRLSLRGDQLDDLIDSAPITAPGGIFSATSNIGTGRRVTLSVNLDAPTARLGVAGGRLTANLQWRLLSRIVDPTTGLERRLSNEPVLNGSVGFSQDVARWKSSWGANVNLAASTVSYRFDSFTRSHNSPQVTAFVDYRPNPDFSLRAEFGNLAAAVSKTQRFAYAGRRDLTGLSFVETSRRKASPTVIVTLRRAF
ncbi:MAG: hypothetical protein JWM33_2642 [Caulobacteraceae bacterium]|nr:hypothetical protein [Caulobacteraceae bacterium]